MIGGDAPLCCQCFRAAWIHTDVESDQSRSDCEMMSEYIYLFPGLSQSQDGVDSLVEEAVMEHRCQLVLWLALRWYEQQGV